MEKNKFFTFLLSFIPGAGHMYLNMMKKGICLMSIFSIIFSMSFLLNMDFLMFVLPVAWFYCFFDTFHMAKLDTNERIEADDIFWSKTEGISHSNLGDFCIKQKKVVGGILIFTSIYGLCYGVLMPLASWIGGFWILVNVIRQIPTILVVVFIFKLGKQLLKSEEKEDFAFYANGNPKVEEELDYDDDTEYEFNDDDTDSEV